MNKNTLYSKLYREAHDADWLRYRRRCSNRRTQLRRKGYSEEQIDKLVPKLPANNTVKTYAVSVIGHGIMYTDQTNARSAMKYFRDKGYSVNGCRSIRIPPKP